MSIRMFGFNFTISSLALIPQRIQTFKKKPTENKPANYVARPPVTPATDRCSLENINPEDYGLVLVSVSFQERQDKYSPGKKFYVVQFWFAPEEAAISSETPSEEFQRMREELFREFETFRLNHFWRTKVYLTPFYGKGVEVPGQTVVNLVCDGREEARSSDGSPVLRRKKDARGENVGTDTVPFSPKFFVEINDVTTEVEMVAASEEDK